VLLVTPTRPPFFVRSAILGNAASLHSTCHSNLTAKLFLLHHLDDSFVSGAAVIGHVFIHARCEVRPLHLDPVFRLVELCCAIDGEEGPSQPGSFLGRMRRWHLVVEARVKRAHFFERIRGEINLQVVALNGWLLPGTLYDLVVRSRAGIHLERLRPRSAGKPKQQEQASEPLYVHIPSDKRTIDKLSLGSDLIGSAYGARLKQKSRRVAMQGRQNVGQKPSYGSKAS
jgi:hypothetical protein